MSDGYVRREDVERALIEIRQMEWERVPVAFIVRAALEKLDGLPSVLPDQRLRKALEGMLQVIDRHENWCGFNRDAPGDAFLNVATRKARAALDEVPIGSDRPEVGEWVPDGNA